MYFRLAVARISSHRPGATGVREAVRAYKVGTCCVRAAAAADGAVEATTAGTGAAEGVDAPAAPEGLIAGSWRSGEESGGAVLEGRRAVEQPIANPVSEMRRRLI